MKFRRVCACLGTILAIWSLPGWSGAKEIRRMTVLVGRQAPQLERFAASELCGYLNKLFHIQTRPTTKLDPSSQVVFLLGSPATNPAVKSATLHEPFAKVSDQGIVLRRTEYEKRPAMILGGGSAPATLWAVYELAERWGVRYLTEGDVLPEETAFRLPKLNLVMEPTFRVRAHPTIQDFADSGEAWGMKDFRPLIDQLAKLKFNRLHVYAFGWQPFLDWESKGIKRKSAWLWYDFHYPITSDMVGRKLFGDSPEFWNPDLPFNASYEEFVKAGEQLAHSLMAYAHQRGMECNVYADLTQFPPEFAPLLKDAQKVHQTGVLTVVPGPESALDDPQYFELCAHVLRATVNTYPEADFVTVGMPEWRQWTGEYEQAWRTLDAKYGIGKIRSLDEVLTAAKNRQWLLGPLYPEKALEQVKGDLASLVFFDRLLHDPAVLAGTRRPNATFTYEEIAEELWPLVGRILGSGAQLGVMPENFQTDVLRRREIFATFPSQEVAGMLHLTLDDDNIGVVPQLTMKPVHELVAELRRDDWAGFTARERFPGDHDWPLVYLARAAWDPSVTPDSIARDQLRSVCGEGCVEEMLQAFHEVEAVTTIFELNDFSFSFPTPRMFMKHWKPGPMPTYLVNAREGYERALGAARRAQAKSTPAGRRYVDYWVGRITFAEQYVEAVQAVREAATAEAAKNRTECLKQTEAALSAMRRGLEAYVAVARNQTDRGAIAVVNEYGYRALKAKIAEQTK